jgi:hypothetical protein
MLVLDPTLVVFHPTLAAAMCLLGAAAVVAIVFRSRRRHAAQAVDDRANDDASA